MNRARITILFVAFVALLACVTFFWAFFPHPAQGLVLVWSTDKQQENVVDVSYSFDGTRMAVCSINKVLIWNLQNKVADVFSDAETNPSCIAFSPNGTELAVGTHQGSILMVNLETLKSWRFQESHDGSVRSIAFSSNGKTLISGGSDRLVILWNTENGKKRKEHAGHSDAVNAVCFCPTNNELFVSAGSDKQILIWNVSKKTTLRSVKYHSRKILSIAFSPDGNQIISGGYDGKIYIYDLVKKNTQRFDFGKSIYRVGFSPTGKFFSACGGDIKSLAKYQAGTIGIWSTTAGREVVSFSNAHSKWIRSFSFNPKNEMEIATGGYDFFVKIWKLEGEKEKVEKKE